jgi:hypothetical protein
VTDARYAGDEVLRGTTCRKIVVDADPAETTIWIDQEHVRRIQTLHVYPDGSGSATLTTELWDFGVPVASVDWSRFPAGTEEDPRPGEPRLL